MCAAQFPAPPAPEPTLRVARIGDVHQVRELIAESVRGLARNDYSPEQIEAALGTAWGVDTRLIADGTYFAVEAQDQLVACGGWSKRRALFGADALAGGEPQLLDPSREAARIRAFFVRPAWARLGIGRRLLARCESEARAAGFSAAELVATLPGERLYSACGYRSLDTLDYTLPGGITIAFVRMRKDAL
jgi:GNAT superfamily N-acetyltransferase